jgi:hypothetical protein
MDRPERQLRLYSCKRKRLLHSKDSEKIETSFHQKAEKSKIAKEKWEKFNMRKATTTVKWALVTFHDPIE